MIDPHPETRIVFVKGIHRVSAIKEAIRNAIGSKPMKFDEWTVVGLANDSSMGMATAMPYHDLHELAPEVGYKKRRISTDRDGATPKVT